MKAKLAQLVQILQDLPEFVQLWILVAIWAVVFMCGLWFLNFAFMLSATFGSLVLIVYAITFVALFLSMVG
jgi:hypothetical protein